MNCYFAGDSCIQV